MSNIEMNVRDRAEFLLAMQNLKIGKEEKWTEGTDFVASDVVADDKVLVRLVEARGKSGFVGAEDVKRMVKVMRRKNCVRGIVVGKRFTQAAVAEMRSSNIQQASDEYMPPVPPENLVLKINDCINSLCITRCGVVPLQEDDCKGLLKGKPCRVRSISDDVLFHYERGWIDLLKNDLRQLLSLGQGSGA
jgi:hypothetical protein